jgi:uncharacterized protein YndB with AHSA1/START domain
MPGYVSVNTISLDEHDKAATRVVTTAQFMTTEERDGMLATGMEAGLTDSYAALDRLLAALGD